ncbi:MAG: WG repeat-containing protein [Halanaerobiales bacterium]
MRLLSLTISLLIVFSFTSYTEDTVNLTPFQENDLWGYKEQNDNISIEARYIFAYEFSEYGIAVVCDPLEGWIYIDKDGEFVIKPMIVDNYYDEFSEGLARFEEDGKIGFFNQKGQVVIDPIYEYAHPFKNGFAQVARGVKKERMGEYTFIEVDKWGFINKKGELAIPYRYDKVLSPFSEYDFAVVIIEGKEIVIDREGEIIEEGVITEVTAKVEIK